MKRLLSLLLALCLTLTLTGCQGSAPEPTDTPEPTLDPTPTPAQTVAPEPMRFQLAYDPNASLDPITGDSLVNRELIGLVYQGLYELDSAFVPQPVLAQSAQPSGDGLVWTIRLTNGVFFSDGTPLTAAHVAASLERARTSPVYAARLSGIVQIAAGEGTVTITLSAPNGNLPALLDVPVALAGDGPAPLGTGYYQFQTDGNGLALGVNSYHFAATLPYTAIPLTPVTSADERISTFNSGEVSMVTTDLTGSYALGYSGGYETTDYPTTDLLYVGFRTTAGPCRSAQVRQAFAQAFDRGSVVHDLLAGHGMAAGLPVSPRSEEYDSTAAALLGYDVTSVAALLSEAGYTVNEEDGLLYSGGRPLAVTLVVNSDSETKQAIAALLADSLENLGVTVTVKALAWADYLAALSARNFDLYIGEVVLTGDFDPTALLAGDLNYGGYQSGTLNALLASWKAAQGADRTAAGASLWERFAQEVPIAPLCFKNGSLLMRWGMASNLQPTRSDPFYHMEEWTTTQ